MSLSEVGSLKIKRLVLKVNELSSEHYLPELLC